MTTESIKALLDDLSVPNSSIELRDLLIQIDNLGIIKVLEALVDQHSLACMAEYLKQVALYKVKDMVDENVADGKPPYTPDVISWNKDAETLANIHLEN